MYSSSPSQLAQVTARPVAASPVGCGVPSSTESWLFPAWKMVTSLENTEKTLENLFDFIGKHWKTLENIGNYDLISLGKTCGYHGDHRQHN